MVGLDNIERNGVVSDVLSWQAPGLWHDLILNAFMVHRRPPSFTALRVEVWPPNDPRTKARRCRGDQPGAWPQLWPPHRCRKALSNPMKCRRSLGKARYSAIPKISRRISSTTRRKN